MNLNITEEFKEDCTEFGRYKRHLNNKLTRLENQKSSCIFLKNQYDEEFMILCVQGNTLWNPNGKLKWEGWKITGKYYRCYLYKQGDYNKETKEITGNPIRWFTTDTNKDVANNHYKQLVNLAKFHTIKEIVEFTHR